MPRYITMTFGFFFYSILSNLKTVFISTIFTTVISFKLIIFPNEMTFYKFENFVTVTTENDRKANQ